jgi:ribonuclease Z
MNLLTVWIFLMPLTVRFLGTSAALPTSKRGLPGVALKYDGVIVLFDCGEGSQLALMQAGWKLSHLRVICISHLHADHVGGLLGILTTRELQGIVHPLTILGPVGIKGFVENMLHFTYGHLNYPLEIRELAGDGGVGFQEGDFQVEWAPLEHRVPTLGYIFVENHKTGAFNVERAQRLGIPEGPQYGELKAGKDVTLPDGRVVEAKTMVGPPIEGRRVAVILDTRPCPNAYRLADHANLLILDGTFAEEHREEADASDHCTATQAAKIALKSSAKKLILTHISARYQEPEILLQEAKEIFPNTEVAYDGMEEHVER